MPDRGAQAMPDPVPAAAGCDDALEDLEDLVGAAAGDVLKREPQRAVVHKRVRRRAAAGGPQDAWSTAEGGVPGTHTVHVKTWGCSHNNSDGEYMAGMLQSYGYRVSDKMDDADLWVLNSCTVKNPSESHFVTAIRRAREQGKRVVVAGCVPQGDRKLTELDGLSVIGVQQIDRVVEVVEETLKGNVVRLYGQKRVVGGGKAGGAQLSLPKIRKNPLVEIIPINTGCLNQVRSRLLNQHSRFGPWQLDAYQRCAVQCTYCKTVHARGSLGSYPPQEIVERVRSVIGEGVREIWLTSEDLGCYGRDIGTNLPDLLWQIVELLPEGTMLRLGMTNPPYILEHREEIAKILRHPRVYAFLHIPVQSGSDNVLSSMRRQYTVAEFALLVDHLHEHVPGITIATDVICGFPTESDEDFQGTLDLVERYRFPVLYISQFYPRPGTPAALMKQPKTQIKKRRSREVSALFKSQRESRGNDKMGSRYWVLVTDRAADGRHLVAHNKAYEQVLLPDLEGLMGSWVEIEVTEVGKFHLRGQLCDDNWRQQQADGSDQPQVLSPPKPAPLATSSSAHKEASEAGCGTVNCASSNSCCSGTADTSEGCEGGSHSHAQGPAGAPGDAAAGDGLGLLCIAGALCVALCVVQAAEHKGMIK